MKARLRSDSGQTLVWLALGMLVLLGIAALAVDVGKLYGERRRMQNAADAAALAGAHEMCQGRTDAEAIAMANDYAIPRNGALWATPVPSTSIVDGKTQKAMDVTVGETVNNAFAIFLNANSTVVSAHAKARCEKTDTGCATWPLTVEKTKFQNMGCGEPFVITFDPNFDAFTCPSGCDCSHVFSSQVDHPFYGWLSCAKPIGAAGCEGVSMEVGECVDAKSGVDEGYVGGGGAKVLDDWIKGPPPNPPVRIPLFDVYGSPCGAKEALIGAFGCFVLNSTQPWQQNASYTLPSLPGQTCVDAKGKAIKISKTLHATVDCTCTVSCGSAGGLPGPKDATIPVLFQ